MSVTVLLQDEQKPPWGVGVKVSHLSAQGVEIDKESFFFIMDFK
jgi:hypothetical protein